MSTTLEDIGEWILLALSNPNVEEDKWSYLHETDTPGRYATDVLGLAIIGKHGGDPKVALEELVKKVDAFGRPLDEVLASAKILGIHVDVARVLERLHDNGISALDIATKLHEDMRLVLLSAK